MTKKRSPEAEPADDPLDQVFFPLDDEQTREFLEIMQDPPPATDTMKALMKGTPPWGERAQIENVLGPLEREGQRTLNRRDERSHV